MAAVLGPRIVESACPLSAEGCSEVKQCARSVPSGAEPLFLPTTREARRRQDGRRRRVRGCPMDMAGLEPHLGVKEPRSPPAPFVLPARLLFSKLRVEEKIGEGRFGTVWRCVDPVTGEQFACKQVDKRASSRALRREIECFARVQGHENVLRLEGVFESELYLYLVTELCNGGDLFEFLSESGPLPEEDAKVLFGQITAAVRHCHARGVMHRDIKPENVLIHVCPATGQITAKLADFGLSKQLACGEAAVGWVGSEPYEAPEVVALQPYNFSADVFSLGVLLFGMLSGTWPTFKPGRVFDEVSEFAWPGWRRMSREAKDLVASMLSTSPAHRPATGQILRDPWLSAAADDECAPALVRSDDEGADVIGETREAEAEAPTSTASSPRSEGPCVKRGDNTSTSSDGSVSEFGWADSEHSTPRSLSEEA